MGRTWIGLDVKLWSVWLFELKNLLNKRDDNCESSIIFNYKITLSSIYVYRGMIILVNLFVWIRQILVSIKMMGESIIFKSKEIKHFYLNNMGSIQITCFLFLVSSWRWKYFLRFLGEKPNFLMSHNKCLIPHILSYFLREGDVSLNPQAKSHCPSFYFFP